MKSNSKNKIKKNLDNKLEKEYSLDDNNQFFLISKKALPSILLKVLKVKELIDKSDMSIANATQTIGISRTTYYKYSNQVFILNNLPINNTISIDLYTVDTVGMLSKITNTISTNNFNIIIINQQEPVNGSSKIQITIETTDGNSDISKLKSELENIKNVLKVEIKSINGNV